MSPAAPRMPRDLVLLALALGMLALVVTGARAAVDEEPDRPDASGRDLFARDCAICHGPEGAGTERGPAIDRAGTAMIDYVLTTGRMPIPDPGADIVRSEPAYTPAQIDDMVAYTATFVEGPAVPEPPMESGRREDLAVGAEKFRANCAMCHQLAGRGGPLLDDEEAPPLVQSTPQQVLEAIRAGPQSMPPYTEDDLSDDEARAIASYVDLELQRPRDPGGWAITHLGPWAEGMVVFFLAVPLLLLSMLWIGQRT